MKRLLPIWILFLILSAKIVSAQHYDTLGADTLEHHTIWLYNSNGKILGDRDSLVSREYFESKWVDLQSDAPYGPETRFICILQAKERPAMVYYLRQTKLSPEVINGIREWNQGGLVMFITEEKNEKTGIKDIRGLKFVLK